MHIMVDGMLSGTGIRDLEGGGFLEPAELQLSHDLQMEIKRWLTSYENEHYYEFKNIAVVADLDRQGLAIAERVRGELLLHEVPYYSNALLKVISIEG